jgi:hypothetical protein
MGIFSRRQVSTIDRIAAMRGSGFLATKWIQFSQTGLAVAGREAVASIPKTESPLCLIPGESPGPTLRPVIVISRVHVFF